MKEEHKISFLLINGMIGILLIMAIILFKSPAQSDTGILKAAAVNMEQSLKVIQDYCIHNQINSDNPEDLRHTGLIGPEWSDITTTVGDPEAKRTTINPNFAALIAHLLQEAGVKRGDTIAIGSSASFPALLIASLSAAKALDLHPLVIFSFGSSSYGASNPDFTIWEMYRLLLDQHIFVDGPVAASLGGEDDSGSEFEQGISGRIRQSLAQAGIPLISEKDLQKNIQIRNGYYLTRGLAETLSPARKRDTLPATSRTSLSSPRKRGQLPPASSSIRAFINSGGGYANLGSSSSILNVKPGLIKKIPTPDPEKQGMIHSMLQHQVPVIHLLYIKGLAQKYHLPWDPVSQPVITNQSVQFNGSKNIPHLFISFLGLLWFFWLMIRYRKLFNSSK